MKRNPGITARVDALLGLPFSGPALSLTAFLSDDLALVRRRTIAAVERCSAARPCPRRLPASSAAADTFALGMSAALPVQTASSVKEWLAVRRRPAPTVARSDLSIEAAVV
jgi:hypothetical protein